MDSNFFKSIGYNQRLNIYAYVDDCDLCDYCLNCTGILQYALDDIPVNYRGVLQICEMETHLLPLINDFECCSGI